MNPEKLIEIPKYNYELKPFGEPDSDTIIINLVVRPNLWIRFWMWFFFGWRFRKIIEGEGVK